MFCGHLLLVSRLRDFLGLLAKNNLNVARVRNVRVDAAMSAVSAAVHGGGHVDLNVVNHKLLGVQLLGL